MLIANLGALMIANLEACFSKSCLNSAATGCHCFQALTYLNELEFESCSSTCLNDFTCMNYYNNH